MIKIVVGGQIDKQELAKLIKEVGQDEVSVDVKSDLEAAMAMKAGDYDYYLGACNTGGGGALAMAIALLGPELTSTVSMPGSIKDESFMIEEIKKGKKAFGFTAQHAQQVVPVLVREFVKNK